MLQNTIDYHHHLPPYRSLLNPTEKYDYRLHSLIPIPPHELKLLSTSSSATTTPPPGTASPPPFKMKYKSLLNDVNRKLSKKFLNTNTNGFTTNNGGNNINGCYEFKHLPMEIQYYIFDLLNHKSLRNCLTVNKDFYKLAKKFLYKDLKFNSTFRFAQFITLLRINPKLGKLVKSVDLSGLKPCNYELTENDEESDGHDDSDVESDEGNGHDHDHEDYTFAFNNDSVSLSNDGHEERGVKAGWRDWKFLKNPLYSNTLTKIQSHNPSQLSNQSVESKRKKLKFSFFKRKRIEPIMPIIHTTTYHPMINKFLINYSNTKDIPIGYLLHLFTLCPNLILINLAGVSLSVDYEINANFIYKFHTFDVVNNYPQHKLLELNEIDDCLSIYNMKLSEMDDSLSLYSSHGPGASLGPGSSGPIWKYHSLLTPLPTNYNLHNDGKLYLSDLNLKSINNSYLLKLKESDILSILIKYHTNNEFFKLLDLSSIIWLNKDLIKNFLSKFLNPIEIAPSDRSILSFKSSKSSKGSRDLTTKKNMIINFLNSGMIKGLPWAQRIDLTNNHGRRLVEDILNDRLVSNEQRLMIEERLRRGRIAENYL